jgi:hypothetical protein
MGKGNGERVLGKGNMDRYLSLAHLLDLSGLWQKSQLYCLSGLQPFALCPKNCFVPENVNYKHIKPAVTAGFNG